MSPLDVTHLEDTAHAAFWQLAMRLSGIGRGAARVPVAEGMTLQDMVWERAARIDAFFAWQSGALVPPWLPRHGEDELPDGFWDDALAEAAGRPEALNWYEICAVYDEAGQRLLAHLNASGPDELTRQGAVAWCGAWPLARWIAEAGPVSAASATATLDAAGF